MLYTAQKIERGTWPDGAPRIKATVKDVTGAVKTNVTISKIQKDGTEFPNFDNLAEGMQFEANEWPNAKGYITLFPPKAVTAPKGGGVAKNMERKEEGIKKSQERKEEGIMLSSSIRMATDVVVAMIFKMEDPTPANIQKEIMKWRYWFIEKWEQTAPIKVGRTEMEYPEAEISDEEIPF